jgi:hypothetical protein
VLTAKLAQLTAGPGARLNQVLLLFKPETVLKWHRQLVRRKWTVRRRKAGGRPAVAAEVEAHDEGLAWENANEVRPHQGLGQRPPVPGTGGGRGSVRRRARLGGVLREYERAAA